MAQITEEASDSEDCGELRDRIADLMRQLVDSMRADEDSGEEVYLRKPLTETKGTARENPAPEANRNGMAQTTAKASDSEDCGNIPWLADCTDDEDSGEEECFKKPPTKTKGIARENPAPEANNNGMAQTTAKVSDSEDCDDIPWLADCTDDEEYGEEVYQKKPQTETKGIAREIPALWDHNRFSALTLHLSRLSMNEITVSIKENSVSSQPEDLPDLVDPDSSDTSRSNSDDECMPGLVDMESSEDSDDSDNNDSEDPHSDSGYAPLEIIVRGPVALEAYNKALAEGKTFDKRVPVMLIGQDRSGKTSLKTSLRGELFNPDEESTVGIDVDPSHFQVSTEIWKAGEKDQETSSKRSISFEYHAARVTVENLKQEKSVVEETIPTSTTDLANNCFISVSPASYSCVSGVSSTSTQAPQSPMGTTVSPASYSSVSDESLDSELGSNIPKDIENEMLKRMQNDHTMEDEEGIYSVLWDFAGQQVYYATHPLFLTFRAMYLLVYDLSQNPSKTAKPVVKQGVYRKFEDSFGMKTNVDYLDFWMSSIASLASQNEREPVGSNSEVLPEKLPPVFLVCTHADRPYNGGDPSTLARELFGSLQTKPYNKHLHDVFVVDNTKSGLESECPEVVRLRNEVLAVSKELPQMKEAIPIKWLKFEKELQAMSKEGHKWISIETATSIASERCNVVDSKEFKTLLNFLHDKRILIHFDETPELNELVVLDPQWLIDVFKKVITVKPYDRQGKKFTELWRKLENKGILDEKLLKQVWGPLFDNRATCESLLQIMGKFSLLCPWPSSDSLCGKQYLVPAMLKTHPPEDVMKLVEVASKTIPPLFLKFESGQVPSGLFPRLVLLFLQWGKQICLCPERTKLFHNFARFFTSEEENWSVILLCLSSSIKVVVHRENPIHESGVENLLPADASYGVSDVTFPCEVRRQLGKILELMRNEFYWLKYMRYEESFICPVCCQGGAVGYCDTHYVQGCKQEECLHFWSYSQLCNAEGIISCTKSAAAINSRVHIVQFAPWFPTQENQPTTDQHDGENLASVEECEAKALVRSSGVLKSQTTCDAENVPALLAESLKLDEATLADPGPEKTRLIRCLLMEAKNANRLDVVKYLRQMTPAGTTGPLLPECSDVKAVSPSLLRELTINLCGGEEWKLLAEKLGLSPAEIRFLDSRTRNPCIEVLSYVRNQRFIDVGTLYDALVECGFPMLADML